MVKKKEILTIFLLALLVTGGSFLWDKMILSVSLIITGIFLIAFSQNILKRWQAKMLLLHNRIAKKYILKKPRNLLDLLKQLILVILIAPLSSTEPGVAFPEKAVKEKLKVNWVGFMLGLVLLILGFLLSA